MYPFARWSRSRIAALWAFGLVVEALLLAIMFTVLVPPDPPLVARLRGAGPGTARVVLIHLSSNSGDSVVQPPVPPSPYVGEDSFYSVVHWPLDRPLLAGGGHLVVLPMWMWWVPALYVGAVPLMLVGLTAAWLWVRRRAQGAASRE